MQQATIKVIKKQGDLYTPIQLLYALDGERKFLLESSFTHETKGKYSFIGANPIQQVIGQKGKTTVTNFCNHDTEQYEMDALTYMQTNFPKIECDLPFPFYGGAIGYVGYDFAHTLYDLEARIDDALNMPDVHLMVYDTIIVYEHRTEMIYLIALGLNGESEEQLTKRLQVMSQQVKTKEPITETPICDLHFQPEIPKAQFIEQIEKAQQLLQTEQLQQIVLSQRFVANMTGDAISFYRNLRTMNPSPYMFYIDFEDYTLVGASPESLIETNGRQVRTNPIAGTRPRGTNEREDTLIQEALLSDEKELLEHDMLVALSKEDLQEICSLESITTPVHKKLERYEYVMHLVSEVHGRLKEQQTSFDAFKACFPAGTVSGSPRKQAMASIQSLEQKKRGVYAGAIGYINANHDMNFAIAIRTLVIQEDKAYAQVGAGIVAQSIPAKEYEETLHKARSLIASRQLI